MIKVIWGDIFHPKERIYTEATDWEYKPHAVHIMKSGEVIAAFATHLIILLERGNAEPKT